MTYTRKPKSLHPYLVQMNSAQAHSWETTEGSVGAVPTVESGGRDLTKRRTIDAQREVIGRYGQSEIANAASTERGSVARFTKQRREALQTRLDAQNAQTTQPGERYTMPATPATKLSERPVPDATLYRRAPF